MISSKTHITNPFITLWHYHTILYKKNEIKLQFLPLHITASFLVFLYENHILDSRISRSSIPMPIPRKAIGWGLFSFVLIIEVAGADGPDGRNIIYRFSFRTRIKFFFLRDIQRPPITRLVVFVLHTLELFSYRAWKAMLLLAGALAPRCSEFLEFRLSPSFSY